ncbi:hypothetical protein C5B42_01460 [Candidatus Cerribacteria bacterium 'Amazon FNV 2010 28 9']|uniref:Uncharacterized protein n=1 Tax=Candidatus Cerribacteria bacterium 'Amazon FNV 2010 28 9' TaxID=2081795 RepID=A0A317JQF5_9BACT|nr:MAG: hypothetical protein C5B42_01460 [Candidatus Cerribacteria bacterium 'Amazon FNV 2010 28 9']
MYTFGVKRFQIFAILFLLFFILIVAGAVFYLRTRPLPASLSTLPFIGTPAQMTINGVGINVRSDQSAGKVQLASQKKMTEFLNLMKPSFDKNQIKTLTVHIVNTEPSGASEYAWNTNSGGTTVYGAYATSINNGELVVSLFVNKDVLHTAKWSDDSIVRLYEFELYDAVASLQNFPVLKSQYASSSAIPAQDMSKSLDSIVPGAMFTLDK